MEVSINIVVSAGLEYIASVNNPLVSLYYNNQLVSSPSGNVRFIAVKGVNTIKAQSATAITGEITMNEYMRNYYDMNDSQDITMSYSTYLNKWISRYSYSPESLCSVSNRLISFNGGYLYNHENPVYNTFYGQVYDSAIAFPHNEAGNAIKVFESIAIEGDQPDHVHIRTEVPYEQSSDLISTDFQNNEGVLYASIYRDRLSPNVSGTPENKLYNGDKMRGEVGKFAIIYKAPTSIKQLKFVSINFQPSKGHTV